MMTIPLCEVPAGVFFADDDRLYYVARIKQHGAPEVFWMDKDRVLWYGPASAYGAKQSPFRDANLKVTLLTKEQIYQWNEARFAKSLSMFKDAIVWHAMRPILAGFAAQYKNYCEKLGLDYEVNSQDALSDMGRNALNSRFRDYQRKLIGVFKKSGKDALVTELTGWLAAQKEYLDKQKEANDRDWARQARQAKINPIMLQLRNDLVAMGASDAEIKK